MRPHPFAFVALASLSGCKDSSPRPESRPSETASRGSAASAADAAVPADAAAPKALAGGMVCYRVAQAYHWQADGTVVALDDASGVRESQDGHVFARRSQRYVALDQPDLGLGAPDDGSSQVWIANARSSLVVSLGGTTKVGRTGASSTGAVGVTNAFEAEGTWWLARGSQFMVETASGFAPVAIPGTANASSVTAGGVVLDGGKPAAIYAAGSYAGAALYIAPIAGDKLRAPTKLATLAQSATSVDVITTPAGGWAVLGDRMVVWSPDGKARKTRKVEAMNLVALDAARRLWVQRADGFVALSPDGTEQAYGPTTDAMFRYVGQSTRCVPLAGGFATLPPVGKEQQGTLALDVRGAAGAPFAVCQLHDAMACVDAADHITGSLDGGGRWSGVVPIGSYVLAVQLDGQWRTLTQEVATNVTPWFCDIQPNKTCTIQADATQR